LEEEGEEGEGKEEEEEERRRRRRRREWRAKDEGQRKWALVPRTQGKGKE